ncbi:hypothetical protein HG530_006682 [Fusarium avenaceum]|nr:hypothetical protein HG530_006682 [Fusarium avenaceum]
MLASPHAPTPADSPCESGEESLGKMKGSLWGVIGVMRGSYITNATVTNNSLALPTICLLPVALAVPDIAVRISAVLSLDLNLAGGSTIDKALSSDGLWRNTLLDPFDNRQENVVVCSLATEV